jgi:hypothetical protein
MVEYVNRKGDAYFLHEGVTKTEKPKYFFSKKRQGRLASGIPDGFEIHESPNALVSLRRIRPQLVTKEEVQIVESGARTLARKTNCLAEAEGKCIVVHTAEDSLKSLGDPFSRMGASVSSMPHAALDRFLNYTAMLRFTLVDEERRLFMVERYCFKGAIDDWIYLAGPDKLETQVARFCKHLDKESLYDMM